MFFKGFFNKYWVLIAMITVALFTPHLYANQIGITFSKDAIGGLGDYETEFGSWEFAADAQLQKSDDLSIVANLSLQHNFGAVGIKPFASYNRDDIGETVDAGGVINFSLFELDIAAGASFRGANPTSDPGKDGWINGEPVSGFTETPPNAYSLPDINNVNGVFSTDFEKWHIETGLTTYVPITKRDLVPVVIISRSQTSVFFTEDISLSLVVDARSYVHTDGAEIQLTPMGSITYRF